MGGTVPMTPIHAFASEPPALRFGNALKVRPARRDIDLGGLLAFVIDGVVTAAEADAIVSATEQFGYRDEAPGISTPPGMRMNKTSHWVTDSGLTGTVYARISHLLPPQIDNEPLFPALSRRLNMYRYDANDVFNRHTDGNWPGYSLSGDRQSMEEWSPSLRSGLTMLLYLNGPADGVLGGSTRLFGLNGIQADVMPVKGSALFFRHGFDSDSVVHAGCRVIGNVSKYVARINVMYGSR